MSSPKANLFDAMWLLISEITGGPYEGESAEKFRDRLLVTWDQARGNDTPENWRKSLTPEEVRYIAQTITELSEKTNQLGKKLENYLK